MGGTEPCLVCDGDASPVVSVCPTPALIHRRDETETYASSSKYGSSPVDLVVNWIPCHRGSLAQGSAARGTKSYASSLLTPPKRPLCCAFRRSTSACTKRSHSVSTTG